MIDWNIQSRSHVCQVSEKPFEENEPYHTLLFRTAHGYERLDISEPVWKDQYSLGVVDRKGFVSHWQGVYKPPPPKAPDPIQKDNAESLLRKLIETNDPAHSASCYILAVMLERKRQLKIQSQAEVDGNRVFVYEQPKTGDVFTIVDPDLQLDQLEQVQQDVADLLEHGLDGPPPEDTDAPEGESAESENTAESVDADEKPAESDASEATEEPTDEAEAETASDSESGQPDVDNVDATNSDEPAPEDMSSDETAADTEDDEESPKA